MLSREKISSFCPMSTSRRFHRIGRLVPFTCESAHGSRIFDQVRFRRAYDAHHMMLAAAVCPGDAVAEEMQRQFSDPRITYIHLHNAKRGCFSCRVERAQEAR
jgi:hypothetical protein